MGPKEKFRLSALRKLLHFKLTANKSTEPLDWRKRRSPASGLAATFCQSLALMGLFLLFLGGFGFPPYLIASTVSKRIVFGRLGPDRLVVHVKRIEYLNGLNAACTGMIATSLGD